MSIVLWSNRKIIANFRRKKSFLQASVIKNIGKFAARCQKNWTWKKPWSAVMFQFSRIATVKVIYTLYSITPPYTVHDIIQNVAGKTWYYMRNISCCISFSSTFHVTVYCGNFDCFFWTVYYSAYVGTLQTSDCQISRSGKVHKAVL